MAMIVLYQGALMETQVNVATPAKAGAHEHVVLPVI